MLKVGSKVYYSVILTFYVFQTSMFMNLWCTTFYGVENCFCYVLVLFFNLALKLKLLWPFMIFSQIMQSLVIVTQYFLSFCITKAETQNTIAQWSLYGNKFIEDFGFLGLK